MNNSKRIIRNDFTILMDFIHVISNAKIENNAIKPLFHQRLKK